MICGYQLNKIKYILEHFYSQLKENGVKLIFIFKKGDVNDHEFYSRRMDDYKTAYDLIKKIEKYNDMEKLLKVRLNSVPFNILVLTAIVQSSAKFGEVKQISSYKECKPSVAQCTFATEQNASWILGLDTNYFLTSGNWKIWCDDTLNFDEMTVLEINKERVLDHFAFENHHFPLFATLAGEFKSDHDTTKKVLNFFGTQKKFKNIASFVKKIKFPLDDDSFNDIATKIFGAKHEQKVIDDFKKSVAQFTKSSSSEEEDVGISSEIFHLFKDDFLSYAEEILINKIPLFISPVFLDLQSADMMNFNTLVLPWIQKTAGILLKNSDDKNQREIMLLKNANGRFEKNPLEIIYPDFEVPELKVLLSGQASTYEKMNMLFWLLDMKLNDTELPTMSEEYKVDSLILLYLIKKKSLTILDARCILKTLFDARRGVVAMEYSTDYPKKVNSRAIRCTFLYSKLYFVLHSCLSCLGMKNLCPEIKVNNNFKAMIFLSTNFCRIYNLVRWRLFSKNVFLECAQ